MDRPMETELASTPKPKHTEAKGQLASTHNEDCEMPTPTQAELRNSPPSTPSKKPELPTSIQCEAQNTTTSTPTKKIKLCSPTKGLIRHNPPLTNDVAAKHIPKKEEQGIGMLGIPPLVAEGNRAVSVPKQDTDGGFSGGLQDRSSDPRVDTNTQTQETGLAANSAADRATHGASGEYRTDRCADPEAETFPNLEKVRASEAATIVGKGVDIGLKTLDDLHGFLAVEAKGGNEAGRWLSRFAAIRQKLKETRIVVGVLGNTGAGKSSLINAVLDEESLIPTNCMRACTAVPTEISFNRDDDPRHAYRGEVEFITEEDWRKEVSLLLAELVDSNKLSSDHLQDDTGAGIAYAKIKAVYPHLSDTELAKCTVNQLLEDQAIEGILGTVQSHKRSNAEALKGDLQAYVDSVEKYGHDIGLSRSVAYWPLVKVVRIFLKSRVLSTGTVLVDLPGVQDSNAARSAVAERFRTECSSLWIVSPINRAVDDKAAKHLLGTSFKLQLTMDGTYSNVTFICSKTDDISVREVADKLDADGSIKSSWAKEEECSLAISQLKREIEALADKRDELDESCENLEAQRPKKRKLADVELSEAGTGDVEDEHAHIRREVASIRRKLRESNAKLTELKQEYIKVNIDATAKCVEARNNYSKRAIRTDFADGVRETIEDAEIQTEGGTQPAPEPDYDVIAKSLPVFCVSSRAYQSLSGRSRKDGTIPGYRSLEDTQIPQLQEHAMRLGDQELVTRNKEFLLTLGRALRSLFLWVATGLSCVGHESKPLPLSEEEASMMRHLDSILAVLQGELESAVEAAIASTRKRAKNELLEPIWPMCAQVAKKLPAIATGWATKGNTDGNPLRWPTYRSILVHGGKGVSPVSKGMDFNEDLFVPLKKKMAKHWDSVFGKTFNGGAATFTSAAKEAMETFHQRVMDCPELDLPNSANVSLLNEQLSSRVRYLRMHDAEFRTSVKLMQRSGGRTFAKHLGEYMKSTYERCSLIRGKGSFTRMKAALEGFIAQNCHEILVKTLEGVGGTLDGICDKFETQMQRFVKEYLLAKMKDDYERAILGRERVMTSADVSPSLKAMQQKVHEALLKVDDEFKDALQTADSGQELFEVEG